MDVVSECGEQEVGVVSVSGLNLWVWLVGVVVRSVYRFHPYSSCICSFLQQHSYFLLIFKMFFVLVSVLFTKIKNELNIFSPAV